MTQSKYNTSFQNRGRDSLVLEFLSHTPVGFDEAGEEKISKYIHGLADILGLSPARKAAVHLSKKFGLSAWLPLVPRSAIHAYVWDDRNPSFISVDISTHQTWDLKEILDYTKKFFDLKDKDLVYKSMSDPHAITWREHADDIHRQRLFIGSDWYRPRHKKEIEEFLPKLCEILNMVRLTDPLVHEGSVAWMHWETSGCIVDWSDNGFAMDIYTCKEFTPEHAVDFTTKHLNLHHVDHRSF